MATATVKIDGAEMELPEEMCKTDKAVREALVPFYPGAANSDVKRETKGEQIIITVTKRAGSKGNYGAIFVAFDAAPEHVSPALLLDLGGGRVKAGDVDKLLVDALADEREINRMKSVLDGAEAKASSDVPEGF